jgi:hypothetical protein
VGQSKLVPDVAQTSSPDVITTTYKYGDPDANDGVPQYYVPCGFGGSNCDYLGASYRGFDKVTAIADDGTKTTHEYFTTGSFDENVMTGREKSVTVVGTPTRQFVNTWAKRKISNCPFDPDVCLVNFVYLDSVVTTEGTVPLLTQYEYDNNGNLASEKQWGKWGVSGDERTIWRPHYHEEGPWIDVPTREYTYQDIHDIYNDTTGGITEPLLSSLRSATTFYYDGNGSYFGWVPPTNSVTKGELSRVERHDGSAPPTPGLYSDVYYAYDLWGNKTAESVPTTVRTGGGGIPGGVSSTAWAYDGTMHVFPIITTDPAGNQTGVSWDLRMGVPTAQQRPNGYEQFFAYDEFGRLWKVWDRDARPGGQYLTTSNKPAVEYIYDWTGALPHSTEIRHRFDTSETSNYAFTQEFQCTDGFGRQVQTRKS